MAIIRFHSSDQQLSQQGVAAWSAVLVLLFSLISSCDTIEQLQVASPVCSVDLTRVEVESIIAHAVEQAQRVNQKVTVAISDREGNILGVFRMTGARLDSASLTVSGTTVQVTTVDTCIRKARTAAFLSSNQHAFSTVTACYITRPHFPPGVANTAAGPLFGVGLSSLPGSDIMPNGNALNDAPGGIPIFKNGCLAGGIGVIGAASQFNSVLCTGQSLDETIALGALVDGLLVANDKRGDNIFIDGIRFLYTNTSAPVGNFTLTFANALTVGASIGAITGTPPQKFPSVGEVMLGTIGPRTFNFPIRAGSNLTQSDVQRIIQQAAAQAAKTRAAIRRPVGAVAQVFIAVVDLDGTVLGIWRTPDATIFSFDVSAQKARTALVFSNPNNTNAQNNVEFSSRIRSLLGLSSTASLSMTTRAVGFLAQDFYPPGIDRDSLGNRLEAGPLFEGTDFKYQRRLLGLSGLPAYGNGITIFPGGIPLYKNGQLAGAIGISGDGVDQDDLIASAGTAGFEAPPSVRCDQFSFRGVRLPYVKFPRQPEIR